MSSKRMTRAQERKWRNLYCRRRKVSLWGQPSMVTPVLIPVIFGDGKQPIVLSCLATRPQRYVIAGDSGWDLDNSGNNPFCEHLEEVFNAIEADWGGADDERFEDETQRQWEKRTAWPALDTSCGESWWPISAASQ